MTRIKELGMYSFGVGDRFSHQAKAQLRAVMMAGEQGVQITPVWNKSFREHQMIGSVPETTREQADRAVKSLGWKDAYFLDADHINLKNVDVFIDSCDFFTIDVADYIGERPEQNSVDLFLKKYRSNIGTVTLPETDTEIRITEDFLREVAGKYLYAVQQAGLIYRHIAAEKGEGNFVTEVSMDETDKPQSPAELYLILAALADERIPVQTIAPKFSGRFNKGVDYVGDVSKFRTEFEQNVVIIRQAVRRFDLPGTLKLSVHSGSDKFSLYPVIREIIRKHQAGLHLKTAGTTWLEELIGLAEAGGSGLELAKDVYCRSLEKYDALCAPYASVIDIDPAQLPSAEEVMTWDADAFTSALRHDQRNSLYNVHLRQLLHVGYKVAAEMGERYRNELRKNEAVIARNVTENIFDRHIRPLFFEG